jgi:DNA ligase (NAD+)
MGHKNYPNPNQTPLNELVVISRLKKLDDAYYNNGISHITDSEYDDLKEKARREFACNRYFSEVGAQITHGEEAKHEYPMKSIQKCNNFKGLEKWKKKFNVRRGFCVTPKYDGVSFTAKYQDGELYQLATRGNGIVGQDITYKAKFFKELPLNIKITEKIEVRGEFILPKNYPNPNQTPLRNIVSGMINRKEVNTELENIHCITYKLVGFNFLDDTIMLQYLQSLNFRVTKRQYMKDLRGIQRHYEEWISILRSMFEYQVDGLVINLLTHEEQEKNKGENDHHWDYQIAYKFPNQAKCTKLIDIEWNVSRLGKLIPTAILEPVVIDNSTIKRATLNNYKNVIKLELRKGDLLLIERANDVIPFIQGVLESSKNTEQIIPSVCPSCGSSLLFPPNLEEEVHVSCSNYTCPERKIQGILYWVKKCKMDGVSEKTIRLLFDKKIIQSLGHLYNLGTEELQNLPGFGEKKINNLLEQINRTRGMSTFEFLSKLGIPLVGKKALKKLGVNTFFDFLKFSDETYTIGKKLIEFRNQQIDYIKSLYDLIKPTDEVKEEVEEKEIVVMTGTGPESRKKLAEKIEQMGYLVGNSISKETNILLCADVNSSSNKIKRAKDLGITIMNYSDFFLKKRKLC